MNYEKKYKEAIEKAKRRFSEEDLKYLFPELMENEDERIRKAIGYAIGQSTHSDGTLIDGVSSEEALAWLEKQGEQKTIWHNEDEEPQRGSLILLIMQSGTPIVAKIIEPNHTFNHGERWAYIDDLLEKQIEQKSVKNLVETWKDMRLEVYQQASGNRHEPNYSDDTTKMFSLNDIDEIIEKISEQKPADKVEPKDYNSIDPHFGKPIDKVEPKFHKGDWIISDTVNKDYHVCKITGIKDGNYTIESTCGYKGYNRFDVFDTAYKLWTVKDVKDGDILVYEGEIFMIKSCVLWNKIVYHCCYDGKILHMHNIYDSLEREDFDKVHPATKEQRDLLFQKIREAGYEWDAEKKELKKIEQKFKVKYAGSEYNVLETKEIDGVTYYGIEDEPNHIDYVQAENCEIVSDHSYGVKEKGSPYPTRSAIFSEQKSAKWSEEDENNILFLTSIIEECFKDKEKITLCADTVCANFTKEDVIDRLKSLKQRMGG